MNRTLLCVHPFSRYCFTKIPFGLESASEVFQKQNEGAFQGIDGIHIVVDDIIIAAEEHDTILQQLLDRAIEQNAKFNFEILQRVLKQTKHVIIQQFFSSLTQQSKVQSRPMQS